MAFTAETHEDNKCLIQDVAVRDYRDLVVPGRRKHENVAFVSASLLSSLRLKAEG